jgi:uncharacterized membrane-anchored protein YjiN (DUF445 family)
MRGFATGLLIGMAALYIFFKYLNTRYPSLALIVAFTEAALVGALADWFAVVALFRNPLGLPIPHTAVIPRNKEKLGENLAHFIRAQFLSREVIDTRLKVIDVSGLIGKICSDEQNAKRIADTLAEHLSPVVENLRDTDSQIVDMNLVTQSIEKLDLSPLVVILLEVMVKGNRHQDFLDEALSLTERLMEENKGAVRERIKKDNPWWVPDFIEDKLFGRIMNKLEEMLTEIRHDAHHGVRRRLDQGVSEFVDRLRSSQQDRIAIDQIKRSLVNHPALMRYLEGMWTEIQERLIQSLKRPDSTLRKEIEKGVVGVGQRLLENQTLKQEVNDWIHSSLLSLTNEYADSIISIISDTVRTWNAEETGRKFELYIGKDLQWIRINGTLVGGLVGVLIYLISSLFH